MPKKSNVSLEVKVRIVEECISGKSSINACASNYGVGYTTIKHWIRLYQNRGQSGLIPTSKHRKYSPETKQLAVNDYLAGNGSQMEICHKFDITDPVMLRSWIKCYNEHKDLKNPNTGGEIYMVKGRTTTLEERIEIIGYCISVGNDYGKTIEKYEVSYQQIYGWVKKYEKNGPDGLADNRGKRKAESSMTEVERLQAQLKLKEAENLRLKMENELLKKLEELERGRDIN